ncbi:MAG: hypothetical protein ACYTKD_17465 [Planctomycetota bacterium]|jgi:hypothetical protein
MTMSAKPLGRMTKDEMCQEAEERGAGFLANMISCWHGKPFTKLAGLVALLRAGHEIRTAQFGMDALMIDGEPAEWAALERAAEAKVV